MISHKVYIKRERVSEDSDEDSQRHGEKAHKVSLEQEQTIKIEKEKLFEEISIVDIPAIKNESNYSYDSNSVDGAGMSELEMIVHREVTAAKNEIISHFDAKFAELRRLLCHNEDIPFKKLTTKHEIYEFSRKLGENETYKIKMAKKLSSLSVRSHHHSIQHGRVATFISFLFDDGILERMRWSEQPGVKIDGRILLVDFPSIVNLFKIAMKETNGDVEKYPDDQSVTKSIQNFFKQRNQAKMRKVEQAPSDT